MDNPSFEATFTNLAKGMPDLERVVARIHAGSCKPKDFLKVLAVSLMTSKSSVRVSNYVSLAFPSSK